MNKNQLYIRKFNQTLPPESTVELRNQLGWPEEIRTFKLQEHSGRINQVPPFKGVPCNNALPAADKPLILGNMKVYVPDSQKFLHLAGALPHWSPESRRITVVNGIRQAAVPGKLLIDCQDTALGTSAAAELEIVSADTSKLPSALPEMLWIDDWQAGQRPLAKTFRKKIAMAGNMEYTLLGNAAESALEVSGKQKFSPSAAQVVFLNIFADACARPWTLPLQIDPFVDKQMKNVLQNLRKSFPAARIVLLLPPPPAPGTSLYPLADSVLMAKLAHYNICSAMLRWHQRSKAQQVDLLPLCFSADPQKDYIMDSRKNMVWSGSAFEPSAYENMAENIIAYLILNYGEKK